ncbi:unnamed protein product [Schistocephalus solidus]|uniref:Cyclic nucleotide-binding domain-containing protein n=1 Tax=Schistocephalus solidus TaxID=70667 RepID=A0A183TMB7_SCHSO|nr:unnamed protein product [Schistocephalus solidus]
MLEKVKRDEESALLAASKPLRAYLQQYIMPTLCAGILECVKQRPEDPLDYLGKSGSVHIRDRFLLMTSSDLFSVVKETQEGTRNYIAYCLPLACVNVPRHL